MKTRFRFSPFTPNAATLVGLLSVSLALATGCTQRTGDDQPDAYVPLELPDAAMPGDASMDARIGADTGGGHDAGSCTTMNLHSNIGPSVAMGTTASGSNRHTPACASGSSNDVWFSWTAPAGGGMFVATTAGSAYDTVVDVLTSCTGSSLACNVDGNGDGTSSAMFTVAAGQTVIIIVDGAGGASGHFVLGIEHYGAEICNDHVDNDGDGLVDCDDFDDCFDNAACIETMCADGIDNDGDGATDCDDFDCDGDPACFETNCTDGIDNDGDGEIDCADFDCDGDPACIETMCADGIDNDGDGATDCADFDCDGDPACVETICDDGIDNDHDLLVDCDDPDCGGIGSCVETGKCNDHRDNDGDDETDCADFDCASDPACTTPETNCTDGIDNDDDARIDCSDDDCSASCGENDATMCMNGTDDDGDGAIDCSDVECTCSSSCPPTTAPSTTCPDADVASAVGNGVFHGTIPPYSCNPRAAATCGNTDGVRGGELEVAWTAPAAGRYVFDTNDTSHAGGTFDTTLSVRSDCDDDPATELACDDDGGTDQLSSATVTLVAGQHVIVVISTYQVWQGGNVTLNIHAL